MSVDSGLKIISWPSLPSCKNMWHWPNQESRPTSRSPPDPTYSGVRHIPAYGESSICWKDYAHHSKCRTMTLTLEEFLRRFLQHVLPKGLPRIRYFGWLAHRPA